MSKDTPFAKEEVMEEYLSSLLRDVEDPADVTARTARLLEKATVELTPEVPEATLPPVSPPVSEPVETEQDIAAEEVIAEVTRSVARRLLRESAKRK